MVRTGWSAEKPFESQLGKSFEKWGQWGKASVEHFRATRLP
jgi:hypothetical protein